MAEAQRSGHAVVIGASMAGLLAARVLEVPKLIEFGTPHTLGVAIFGGIVSGVAAYASTALLILLFRRRDVEALGPFGYYCIGAGAVSLVLLVAR